MSIERDGPCVRATSDALLAAPDPADRLSPNEVVAAREMAADIVADVVASYERSVASGEVGSSGSGVAAAVNPSAGVCPTGLLYGKVQSGKTRAMIFTSSMCLDNGFRVVIVLTSNNVKLVEQTTDRFRQIDGPIVLHSRDRSQWDSDSQHVRQNIGSAGLVVVCAKDPNHQRAMNEFLRAVGADGYPAIIMDDEADQATLDTTRASRAAGNASAPAFPSTTHRLTVENTNPAELGNSLRETLRHHVFVQVTATPFALLLQGVDDPLRPDFTKIIEPGSGYRGGDWYFSQAGVDSGNPPLSIVDPTESAQAMQADPNDVSTIPEGLRLALATFCLSAAARDLNTPGLAHPSVFLCHTSHKTDEHQHLEALIQAYLAELLSGLSTKPISTFAQEELDASRSELARTLALEEDQYDRCVEWIARRLLTRNIATVNYNNSDFSYQRGLNVMIGGNILGRGLTIKGLICTYYLRSPRTSQMDTMLQHARMFGYPGDRGPFLRVFLPLTLARRFAHIVETEVELRDYLGRGQPGHPVPVRIVNSLRATRANVLDTSAISAYRPGQQVYPMDPEFEPSAVGTIHARIARVLEQQVFNGPIIERQFVEAPLAVVKEIVDAVRLRDNSVGTWDANGIKAVLDDLEPDFGGRAKVYVRRGVRTNAASIYSGAASGDEIRSAKQQQMPVLMVFEQTGNTELGWGGTPFWFPTVVFPESMDARLFNTE